MNPTLPFITSLTLLFFHLFLSTPAILAPSSSANDAQRLYASISFFYFTPRILACWHQHQHRHCTSSMEFSSAGALVIPSPDTCGNTCRSLPPVSKLAQNRISRSHTTNDSVLLILRSLIFADYKGQWAQLGLPQKKHQQTTRSSRASGSHILPTQGSAVRLADS
jgi:hypothetical protein